MSKLTLGGDKFYKMKWVGLLDNDRGEVVTDTLNWESEKIFPENWMTKS